MARLDDNPLRRHVAVAAWLLALAGLTVAALLLSNCHSDEGSEQAAYDPLALAYASAGHYDNLEAGVPSMCYTKTAGVANPCWTCHTTPVFPNELIDRELQEEYAFSDVALTNHWSNLFTDRSAAINAISDDEALAYVRQDNYAALVTALKARSEYPGYVPDLDFELGFDVDGFAADGSHWRAIRYKPFLGTFWPTNGSTDDVLIRLPAAFRSDASGNYSREIHKLNYAILEAAICADPAQTDAQLEREVEPVDESLAGVDLDGSGTVGGMITRIRGLPAAYAGGASGIAPRRFLYPTGTEFLHTVRYIDPDAPSMIARRMKEVRYSRKNINPSDSERPKIYSREMNEKEEGRVPLYSGGPDVGLRNAFGWQLQGFIEDEKGRLRLQTHEEHVFCMGCHTSLGVTCDSTFTMPRKVPGAAGWRYQDLAGIPDVPQAGHSEPEILTYFKRVQGGDEFRANDEILARFFPGGVLDENAIRTAAPGGGNDIRYLVAPSRSRALLLNKAYMALVRSQRFDLGRDTLIAPPANVHRQIQNGSTELGQIGKVFSDGRLWLDWP
jgi:hypothetical protein